MNTGKTLFSGTLDPGAVAGNHPDFRVARHDYEYPQWNVVAFVACCIGTKRSEQLWNKRSTPSIPPPSISACRCFPGRSFVGARALSSSNPDRSTRQCPLFCACYRGTGSRYDRTGSAPHRSGRLRWTVTLPAFIDSLKAWLPAKRNLHCALEPSVAWTGPRGFVAPFDCGDPKPPPATRTESVIAADLDRRFVFLQQLLAACPHHRPVPLASRTLLRSNNT